jgi:uncharacterized membrane protein
MKHLKKKKRFIICILMIVFIVSFQTVCFAGVDVQQGMDPLEAMGNLASYIMNIVMIVGVIALIWGGVQLALALKSQDASQRTNAILFLAGGAIMVGIKFVLQAIGVSVS